MAADIHLKIEGVEGEDTHDKHKGEIEIQSYSMGATQSVFTQGTGQSGGKANVQPMSLSMFNSKASTALLNACFTGEHYPTAILTARKAGGTQLEYLVITLCDVMVSSFQHSASNGGGVPIETISLEFDTIEMVYNIQGKDQKVKPAGKTKFSVSESVAK